MEKDFVLYIPPETFKKGDCSDIVFGSGILEIMAETIEPSGTAFTITSEKRIINEEYDEPVRLSDIREKYPTANMITVIAESALQGWVFRFGNHGEFWEQIGNTAGYA